MMALDEFHVVQAIYSRIRKELKVIIMNLSEAFFQTSKILYNGADLFPKF